MIAVPIYATPTQPTAPPVPTAPPLPILYYDGRGRAVLRLVLGNAILGLLTGGLYRFWAKTRFRRHIWNHIVFDGDRLEYMGRPDELMIGLIVVAIVFIPIAAALGLATDLLAFNAPKGAMFYHFGTIALLYLLGQLALYRARFYRMSRTAWRGIRFRQSGSAFGYMRRWLGWSALTTISLGLLLPFRNQSLYRYRMGHTWLGDRQIHYDRHKGSGWGLMPRWFLCWLLLAPSLGASYAWYRAAELRYFIARTKFGALEPSLDISSWKVLKVYAWPAIIMLITIGLGGVLIKFILTSLYDTDMWSLGTEDANGIPIWLSSLLYAVMVFFVYGIVQQIITHRLIRAIGLRLRVEGPLDAYGLRQSAERSRRSGEGLADVLDAGGL